jgi:uncharacterized protein (TIGR03437 family)
MTIFNVSVRLVYTALLLGPLAHAGTSDLRRALQPTGKATISAEYSPKVLTSGTPFTLTIGPVTSGTLFSGDFSSIITVPSGATKVEIRITTAPATADVDLYARFGADVDLSNGTLILDHKSTSDSGIESIVITPSSTPALQSGDYYVALGLFSFNVTATVTITATVTGGVSGPVVASNSLVNAADGSAAISAGTIFSIYGSNLATGLLSGPLPMVTTLLGTSVEVLSNGQTYSAPLFFVSSGQINAQLPYEVQLGSAQARVRTTAGISPWASFTVQTTAPRILTSNMRGYGTAIMQHGADYSLVTEEAPAQAGEMLVLYLVGLGQTQPAARTGIAAGNGTAQNPVNASSNVMVTIGGLATSVYWAGLTPGFVGLYQINFAVPIGVAAGEISLSVGRSSVNSQANVTAMVGASGTAVVSSVGGTLKSGGTAITVPAGAFNQPVTLRIAPITGLSTPTDGRITAAARVEGLPATVLQPIKLALDLIGTPPQGSAFIVVRFETDDGRGPMFLPAKIENGQLVAELSAMPTDVTVASVGRSAVAIAANVGGAAVVDNNPLNAALWGVAGVREEASPGGKATVHYQSGDIRDFDLAVDVGKLVDEAFVKLAAAGVETSRRKNPVDIYLFSFSGTLGQIFRADKTAEGETETELWGKANTGLSLNVDVMRASGAEAVRTTVGHELFHILQGMYDPRPLWRRSYVKSTWLWMMEAASTWFEKKMSRSGNAYLSPNAQAYDDFLLRHGLEFPPGNKEDVQRHGYGASMFLDYLTQTKGDTYPGIIFREMEPSSGTVFLAPKYSPVDGLSNGDVFLSFKWTDFVDQYASGKVHPARSLSNWVTSTNVETYTVASDNEINKSFQWDAPDLSAHLYKLDFKKWTTQWPAGSKVTFQLTAPGDVEMTVWKSQLNSGWVQVAKTTSSYEIPNGETLASGATYAVLIANGTMKRPYDGTTSIKFELKGPTVASKFPVGAPLFGITLETSQALVFKHTETQGTFTRVYTGPQNVGWTVDGNARCPSCTIGVLPHLQWSGTSFSSTVQWQYQQGDTVYDYKDTVNGQLTADGRGIVFITAHSEEKSRSPSSGSDRMWEYTVQNLTFPIAFGDVYAHISQQGSLAGVLTGVKSTYHTWDISSDYLTELVSVDAAGSDWRLTLLFEVP